MVLLNWTVCFCIAALVLVSQGSLVSQGHSRRNAELMRQLGEELELRLLADSFEESQQPWKMTHANGRQVTCNIDSNDDAQLEQKGDPEKNNDAGITAKGHAKSKSELMDELFGIFRLLGGRCLAIEKGYWTYEFCPDQVYQFHGQTRKLASTVWSLGILENSKTDAVSVSEGSFLYVGLNYRGGQHCDETGKPRESRAIFFCCSDQERPMDQERRKSLLTFESIEEHSLCNYTLTLCSPRLCQAGLRARGVNEASSALKALSGLCFQRTFQWWTYELCVEKAVKQFHMEERVDGKGRRLLDISSTYELGTHVTDASFDLPAFLKNSKTLRRDPQSPSLVYIDSSKLEPAVVQIYAGGSPCDVENGLNRFTVVRFICDKDADALNEIKLVEEISSCVYQLVFHTELLCQHTLFAERQPKSKRLVCEEP